MTDCLRRALTFMQDSYYDPNSIHPFIPLLAQRQINTALTPWVMTNILSWKQLMLLIRSDTAHLTQQLRIPYISDDEEIDGLVLFLSKRGNRPFDKLAFYCTDIRDIYENMEPICNPRSLTSQRYEAYRSEQRFPDSTTELSVQSGTIWNIPKHVVNLTLSDVIIEDAMMEAIGQSQFIANLKIIEICYGHDTMFRGLPIYLETLDVEFRNTIIYARGYSYHCEYLRRLKVSSREEGPRLPNFPPELINSMTKSLKFLHIAGELSNEGNSLPTVLKKLEKLEELAIEGCSLIDEPIPPTIRTATIGYGYILPRTGCYSSLMRTESRKPINFDTLLDGCQKLENLSLTYTETRLTLPSKPHPTVKTLQIEQEETDPTMLSWIPITTILHIFPNLTHYNASTQGFIWTANFATHQISLGFNAGYLEKLTRLRDIDLSLEESNFEKIYITLNSNLKRSFGGFHIALPPTTKEITLGLVVVEQPLSQKRRSQNGNTTTHNIEQLHAKEGAYIRRLTIFPDKIDISVVQRGRELDTTTLCHIR